MKPRGFCAAVIIISFITLPALQMDRFADDPGVGWHLKTGEYISQNGFVPLYDPFLSFNSPRRWVSDQWYADLMLYKLYSMGSWPLVYSVLTALYLFFYFGVLMPGLYRLSGSKMASAAGAFLAFKLGLIHFILRPSMMSFFLFSVVYLICMGWYRALPHKNSGSNLKEDRLLVFGFWLLPFLFVLWANIHPAFVLGLALMCFSLLAAALDCLLFKDSGLCEEFRGIKSRYVKFLLLTVLALAATFVNPNTWRLHQSIASLFQSGYFMEMYQEWHAPAWSDVVSQLMFVSLGVMLVTHCCGRPAGWRSFEYLLIAVFSVLALRSVRIMPFYAIAVSLQFTEAVTNLKHSRMLNRKKVFSMVLSGLNSLERREKGSNQTRLVQVLCLLIVGWTVFTGKVLLYRGEFGPSRGNYPYGALEWLKKNKQNSAAAVASFPEWGGFLTFYGEGIFKAVIDDRSVLLGKEFYGEFFSNIQGDTWRAYLKKRGVKYVLVRPSSSFAGKIRVAGLKSLYEDKVSVLFEI